MFDLALKTQGLYEMTTKTSLDYDYMTLALELAQHGRFTVSPNPMVGCVIVKDNLIVGQGYHKRAGEPHAEIYALQEAGVKAEGATVYVTLEPCCHYNRTPPCTNALIQADIKKVYVACLDPNPLVAGKGVDALKAAGIDVEIGLKSEEAKQLNEIFFHYIRHKQPFVISKWAMSLDGKTITHPDDTRDISCEKSRIHSHTLRQQVDAILIGAKTAIHDDPLLTVRYSSDVNSKQPIRIILTNQSKLPHHLKLFDPKSPVKTIIVITDPMNKKWYEPILSENIEIMTLPKNIDGEMNLSELLNVLGKKEITSLLIEGGMTVHENFFKQNLVNKIHVYLAPLIIGKSDNKKYLSSVNFTSIERDIYFTADYEEKICSVE